MTSATENGFLGALLGMAIGDALGAPLAGEQATNIGTTFGAVTGYLPVTVPDSDETHRGEFTDETEIALCLVESMTANQGRIDPETAGMRMVHLAAGHSRHWLQPATAAALDLAGETLEFSVPAGGAHPATGDVASRGAPIGLMHAVGRFDAARLRADALIAAQLTDGTPEAAEAVSAVAFLTRLAATGAPRETWASETAAFLGRGALGDALRQLAALSPGPSVNEAIATFGDGIEATSVIPTAIVVVLRAPRFEDAVFAAVQAGGAADTRGALAGALAGA
ncbi:MAG: ADP-ribosylglycohydrolase family protein, partial [Thermomicrobiales bacterium]